MIELSPGWDLTIKRGPDLLIVEVKCSGGETPEDLGLADRIWSLLQQHFTNRLVLDLTEIEVFDGYLPEELLRLEELISDAHGVIRICGLSESNQEIYRQSLPEKQLPVYRTPADAVFCSWRPTQPR
jgi:hypothetical protein